MPRVVGPNIRSNPQVDRWPECQRAIQDEFEILTGIAENAGWSWQEIVLALMELTEAYALAMRSDEAAAEGEPHLRMRTRTLH
ncbi:hypothetical protein [Sinorhizobium saheli]|uniref:Uncharacterized protein n=1 Tax=Sinorhizobium saheli TaxID=36856 RepID=A0A178Y8H7_SINSA|nr:hypothetical protein [Sinorhizobium saheli]MQW90515.1 hypothetical protein [Sinorhizobium saheli]OAP43811.1 hypothetical protein ATB98_07940 [Sinorhizobium saheli]